MTAVLSALQVMKLQSLGSHLRSKHGIIFCIISELCSPDTDHLVLMPADGEALPVQRDVALEVGQYEVAVVADREEVGGGGREPH